MKYLVIKPFYGNIFLNNNIFRVNNGHNIFYEFDKKLKKEGIVIDTIDSIDKSQPDKYIYVDVPYPWQIKLWLKLLFSDKNKNILFCFESPLVNPFNHMTLLHRLFNKVITWNDDLVQIKKYNKFCIPQLKGKKVKKTEFKNKKLLTAVYSNKSAPLIFRVLSKYKTDLYEKRYRLFKDLEKYPEDFHLYGKGWNKKRAFNFIDKITGSYIFGNYKGKIDNKLDVLAKYKYCISFENASAPGYITEKIFDCFQAGCVPVYLGAPNISKYIPKNTFIDYRDFDDPEKLVEFLQRIEEAEYKKYQKNARLFLEKSSTTDRWFEGGFAKLFLSVVMS